MNSKNTRSKTNKSSNEKTTSKQEINNIQNVNEIVENKLEGGLIEVSNKDNKKTKLNVGKNEVKETIKTEKVVKEEKTKENKLDKKVEKNVKNEKVLVPEVKQVVDEKKKILEKCLKCNIKIQINIYHV